MVAVKVGFRGMVEAQKFLADFAKGAQSFAGVEVAVGTPLPRGLFTDTGTRRGTTATHWLSGLEPQAAAMAKQVLADKLATPLELAHALTEVANKIKSQAMARARRRTGRLQRSITVVAGRGPGARLGLRR